jgi:hypothetical protein
MSLSAEIQEQLAEAPPETGEPPIEATPESVWENIRVIADAFREGKIGQKELKYLFIIIVFQISMIIVDILAPSSTEMNQFWFILFVIAKIALSLIWMLWGGWMKKQIQTVIAANRADKEQYKREFEQENLHLKEAINVQSVELQKEGLAKEKAEWKVRNLETDLAAMTAEKKKWKKMYYDSQAAHDEG